MKSKKAVWRNRVEWYLPGAEKWGKWGDAGQRIRWIRFGDLTYMIIVVNNTVFYTLELKFAQHKKEMVIIWDEGSVS